MAGVPIASDLIAINKPPAGTTCPAQATFNAQINANLRDTSGQLCFTPVPANQIDPSTFSASVCRAGTVPSNRLTIHTVGQAGGLAVFNPPKNLVVPAYDAPPSATQPTVTQTLDTLDARNTNAVLANNPVRGTYSLWTQHTVANVSAAVRWYEINPLPAAPSILATGLIRAPGYHYFNAAISPDRRREVGAAQFGGSFVIGFSASRSAVPNPLNPSVLMGSSVNGAALSFKNVLLGPAHYVDNNCPNPGDQCRWGDYSGASPDPRPLAAGATGVVGLANQFPSGAVSTAQANWRTVIWEARP